MIFATPVTAQYSLTVEASTPVVVPGTTYRFYVDMLDPTDRMSAVFGNNNDHFVINTPDGAYNNNFNSSWNASGINPMFLQIYPEMADDTYATIGLTGPASTSGITDASDPYLVEDTDEPITPYFLTDGATSVSSTTLVGSAWYILNPAGNGLPDADMRVLILQVTTTGSISGTINYQVFPLGVGEDQVQISMDFDGAGLYVESVPGCTDNTACNYNAAATTDDGSCTVDDECGDCGGDDSSCVDACGVPNGDESTCTGCMIAIACNYDSTATITDNTLCEYESCEGCTDETACNFDPAATLDDGSHCIFIAAGECDCDGTLIDECGVCGGAGIPDGDCDCDGNILDECGVCGGGGNSVECWDGSLVCSEADCAATPEFLPTVNMSLDNLTESGTSSLIYTMSQNNGESEILSSSVISDGGSFNLSDLMVGDVIGSGTLSLSLFAGNFDIESDLTVSNITNGNYTIFNQVTASNSPVYPIGSIAGGFVISNTASGISISTEIPVDEDYITEAYSMSLTFDDLFVNPSGGDLTFTSTLTAELGDVDVQNFEFTIETLDFTPTVSMTLDNLTESGTSSLTYTMSQDDGESEILSSSVVSDGGSFNLSGLALDDVVGSGTLSLSLYAGDFDIESDLVVTNIDNDIYHVFNQVTASNSPVYPVGSIAGGFVISNTASGISISTEIPTDEDYITEAYSMSLTFDDLFVNPSGGDLTFTSTLTAELGNVDVQHFVFNILSIVGCTDPIACNYSADAFSDDGSCVYCGEGCESGSVVDQVDYTLTVESAPAEYVDGHTVYRFYVNMLDPADKFSAVFGNNEDTLVINTPNGIFNSEFNASWNASGINPAFLPVFPEMVEDSYATIGLDGPGVYPQTDPSLAEDDDLSPSIAEYFVTGGTSLNVNTLTGGSWYVLNTSANALPDSDLRVLVMQITTTGVVSGSLNYQIFPLGSGANQVQINLDFDGAGTFGTGSIANACGCTDAAATNYDAYADYDDGSCLYDVPGCMDANACNYDPEADLPDDTCTYAEAPYDCFGECVNDSDGDLVCDENEIAGCDDPAACNYDAYATEDDGTCEFTSCLNYSLTIESNESTVTTGTTYRFYVEMTNPTDRLSAVFGHDMLPLTISAPAGVFNSPYNGSWSASGINPAFLPTFPDMAADSYLTIGLDGPAVSSGIDGAADPSLVEDVSQPLSPFFINDGSTSLEINTVGGAAVYLLNSASNGLPDENMRVLIMQITTAGSISGTLNYQVFPLDIGTDELRVTSSFSEGEDVGCMDANACNYILMLMLMTVAA